MSLKTQEQWREAALERLEKLAAGSANDAVKLLFMESDRLDEIEGLDLTALAELKKSANGAMELKLVDKVAVITKLCEIAKGDGEGAEAFFLALEGSAAEKKQGG